MDSFIDSGRRTRSLQIDRGSSEKPAKKRGKSWDLDIPPNDKKEAFDEDSDKDLDKEREGEREKGGSLGK